ncbi:E3 ubiquitin-protein ligase mind-bomb [Paragonimus heterotremus]|uniref:E3 ubiquitin-protein ligase mind-bomb n=1 Tax=Paragonimus heterotremus TaxID=100268 RepID=A0A8J4STG1_9TREM|nr:E3 ubiquitin-protein ligase mind-bomb [Paragonimus heterotremus]
MSLYKEGFTLPSTPSSKLWNDTIKYYTPSDFKDGGEGHVGSLRRFDTPGEAIVVWDSGIVANYRCGTLGFDLRVLDSAPTGVKHPGTICEGCHESPIYGIRWKCVVCLSTDLCSSCYHGDKHTLAHQFLRITAPYKTRVIVGRRLKQRRVEAMGLFPKARVVRGIDWSWDSQDCVSPLTSSGAGSLLLGTSGSVLTGRGLLRSSVDQVSAGPILLPTQGRITDRRDWYPWAPRSAALVAWDSGAYNVYRVGYAGLIDLKAIRPAKGGTYYVDHLPLLADLRGYSNMEPVAVAEESTACVVEDDGAELCRDSSGNPLVPNWTNLQDLEIRRRQQTMSALPENRRCHRVTSASNRNRDQSQDRSCQQQHENVLVDHTSGLHAGQSTGTHEPAASSCLNVCTLASRLQLQPSSVESCNQLNPTGRSHSRRQPMHSSQCTRERETEQNPNSRSSATSSGGLRTLGQTARSLLTDLLRTNLSSTSSAPSGSRSPGNLSSINQTQSRANITSPPSLRSHNRSSRGEDRTTTLANPNAVILSRISHQRDRNIPNTAHQQRILVNAEERAQMLTLIPIPMPNYEEPSAGEVSCARTDTANTPDCSVNESALRNRIRTGQGSRETATYSRLVYGVYNQLDGLNTDHTATALSSATSVPTAGDLNSLSITSDGDITEQNRRACPRAHHCRPFGGQTNEDLIRAAGDGNVKRLKCLLQHHHVNVNTGFAGSTALHVACDAGHLACVALLLQFGAKRQLRDGSGNQAVHAAAQGGNVNILRLLLDPCVALGGERPTSPNDEVTITCGDSTGNLLDSDGCTGGTAQRLPSAGSDDTADVNSRNALRQTPLHLAVNRHDFIVAQCLLEEWNALSNLQVILRF